jgi:uncharacterized protein (DUF697 family)
MVCMARADGVLKADERFAIEDALAGARLPDGVTLDDLLYEKHDPAQLAATITSPDVRDYTYASVFSIAYCDRELAEPEQRLLDLLRSAWQISPEDERALVKALEIGSVAANPDEALPPTARSRETRKQEFDTLLARACIVSGLTGAIPIPLVPDLLVVPMQVKLVHSVAGLFGRTMDKQTVQLMFETLGVGVGARIGITALCKLVPGWGSLVGGASSFASTYALGQVAYMYLEKEEATGSASFEDFKNEYREQRAKGHEAFHEQKAAIADAERSHAARLRQLAYDLQQGRITHRQYEAELDRLT